MPQPSNARVALFAALGVAALLVLIARDQQHPPPTLVVGPALPSWNEGDAKRALLDFVGRVTQEGGKDFVPPEERVAVFDNDGTLWTEHPIYFQVLFAFERVKALSAKHPEWKDRQPFKGVLENDMKAFAAAGDRG